MSSFLLFIKVEKFKFVMRARNQLYIADCSIQFTRKK